MIFDIAVVFAFGGLWVSYEPIRLNCVFCHEIQVWLAVNVQYCFCSYMTLGLVRQYRYHALLLLPRFFFHTNFFISSVQNIYTDSLSITVTPSSGIRLPSFIFNMFGVLKPSLSKRPAATSPSSTSKRGRPARQPPSPSQQRRSSQSALSSELPSLVRMLCDVCLVYGIYLVPEFLAHCHLRMFRLIVVRSVKLDRCHLRMLSLIVIRSVRLDRQDAQVSAPLMQGMC